MKLTDLETKMLQNIITNDFGEEPYHVIWANCWDCGKNGRFVDGKVASGIISSLSKKGLVLCQGDGEDATIELTKLGQTLVAS